MDDVTLDASALVAVEHRRLLIDHGRRALPAAAVGIGFVAVKTFHQVSTGRRALWIAIAVALLVGHAIIVVADRGAADRQRRLWSAWPLAALHGVAWALTVLLLWPPTRDDQLLLFAFMVAFCAAVALASAPFLGHAAVVLGPPVVVTGAQFLRARGRDHVAIAVGLVLYATLILALHARSGRILVRAIRLQVEHDVRNRQLGELVMTDPLTAIGNRRALVSRLQSLIAEGVSAAPASLALLDLDQFKQVNDRLGHVAGDEVLTRFAEIAVSASEVTDLVARTGGEEFAIVLPGVGGDEAVARLEHLRRTVADELVTKGESVTVSVGVHQLRPDDSVTSALERADLALYRAKREGRNCVMRSG